MTCRQSLSLLSILLLPAISQAGLYYSGETMAELPSQWRGFLLDQRTLRTISATPKLGAPVNPIREQYLKKADDLIAKQKEEKLTPDEIADLGAIYIRLGKTGRAVELLRPAQRANPKHFRIAANLGTAWQLHGDLQQASLALLQAVRLAPKKNQEMEEYHLKLVRSRLRDKEGISLDKLFGVTFVGPNKKYQPGKMSALEKKKLPKNAVSILQQLCLWFPADPQLLWQLAEVANAHGEIRVAANMMDGCVIQFGLQSPQLRRHRQILRAAVDAMPKPSISGKEEHKRHVGGLVAKSKRPLLTKIDPSTLPAIDPNGINKLPWAVVNETEIDRKFRPTFPEYLKKLSGKKVELYGFMQPFSDDLDVVNFMFIEYPVGCWYCEMPEITGIILVELPPGKTAAFNRGVVRVSGRLSLNYSDPEEFLYIIRNAKVGQID